MILKIIKLGPRRITVKSCENKKVNRKDCLIDTTFSNIEQLSTFIETHTSHSSANQYIEEFKAKQRFEHICKDFYLIH